MRKREVNDMKLENSTKISHPSHNYTLPPRAIQHNVRCSSKIS